MNIAVCVIFILLFITIGTITPAQATEQSKSKTNIPGWVKQVAEFWISDQIDDSGFVQVIEYLVQQGIITIPYAESPEGEGAAEIPIWIKINAEFWVNGKTSDDEFATALEWLINNGIIKVQDVNERVVSSFYIEGNHYPIYQFTLTPSSPDCPDSHLHATSGYTVDGVLVSFTDHDPGGCGLGMVDDLTQHYTMTENQILKWEEITGIKIPQE